MKITIDTSDFERAAEDFFDRADEIASDFVEAVTESVREAHDELQPSWPSEMKESTQRRGKQTQGQLSWREQTREDMVNAGIASARHQHKERQAKGMRGRKRSPTSSSYKRKQAPKPRRKDRGNLVTLLTRGDEKTCPICEEMEGLTFTIEEANEVLPLHPHCRCIVVPASDLRYGPVVPDDPADAIVQALLKRVPNILKRVSGDR